MNVHSVSAELATLARKTRGVVLPKLVGASTTVVGNKMYLFGGRLVVERRMLCDLYVFDLETYTWDKVEPTPDNIAPGPRYFHSADAWNNHLVIFGGMGYKSVDQAQESLCVLNDVCFYSLAESRWLPVDETPPSPSPPQSLIPRARYAHLSSISSDMLFIIGGQDLSNGWLDDIHVYNLSSRSWVQRSDYPRHCGTYRSVALSSSLRVRDPSDEPPVPPVPRFNAEDKPSVAPVTPPESLVELPYSCAPTSDYPSEIFLYSNYNFTDVKRELEVFTPQPPASFTITDRSSSMSGVSLPPGLRFPTGALLGNSLIIAGTYLAHSYQAFSIWSLDLTTMHWSRIEPGTALATGSWCRAVLWRESNKLLVFGNREGNLVEDYNHRLLSWDHVAYIDLEAFGIYQPPSPGMGFGRVAQMVGLAALEDGALADFEVLCDDGRRIPCSRKMLEERWPWFRTQRQRYVAAAVAAVAKTDTTAVPALPIPAGPTDAPPRPDPRLTPRVLHLAEPFPITLAFLQYLYAQALVTPLQLAPPVLSALLLLGTTYDMEHLRNLVKHAMHRALSMPGNQSVSGIYDVATLCDCQSLRLRAMRMIKVSRRPPGRSRQSHERHGGSGGGSGHGGRTSGHHHHARPRGLSDANPLQVSSGSTDQGHGQINGQTNGASHAKEADSNQKLPLMLRRPSQKRRSSELDPVTEVPSSSEESLDLPHYAFSTALDRKLPEVVEYPASDDDEIDPELLGLVPVPSSDDLTSSSGSIARVSYNARPSSSRHTPTTDQDEYFFGTQPDHSPLSSTFPPPDRVPSFRLPYPAVPRASRSTSMSDTPSLLESRSTTHSSEESHSGSSGTRPLSETPSSSNSSVPMTPLTPALAEIVDAVSKASIMSPPDRRLSRQTSLHSIHEHENDEIDHAKQNFAGGPVNLHAHVILNHRSTLSDAVPLAPRTARPASRPSTGTDPDGHRWLHIDTALSPMISPGDSYSSLDLTPLSAHSLSDKSSFDHSSSDRHSSMTPVPHSGGGLARFLSPKRSGSRLEKDLAKARSKAEKLEQKLRLRSEKEQQRFREQGVSPRSSLPSMRDTIIKFGKSDEKKSAKELEKQKARGIAEHSKVRAEHQGFEGRIGRSGESFAVSGVGGL